MKKGKSSYFKYIFKIDFMLFGVYLTSSFLEMILEEAGIKPINWLIKGAGSLDSRVIISICLQS